MAEDTPTPAAEPAPEPPKKPRRPRSHILTRVGSVVLGQRPEDKAAHLVAKRATKLGLIGVVVYQLLGMVGGVLGAYQRQLDALPAAVAQAIKEASADRREDSAELAAEVRALRSETASHQASDAVEFAQLRGVVAGRLKCPPCPTCKPCPAPPVEPTTRWQRDR